MKIELEIHCAHKKTTESISKRGFFQTGKDKTEYGRTTTCKKCGEHLSTVWKK